MKILITMLFVTLGSLTMASVCPNVDSLLNQGGLGDSSVNDLWWNVNDGIDAGDVVISCSPVPEPCTLIMFGGGAIALFGFGRKK